MSSETQEFIYFSALCIYRHLLSLHVQICILHIPPLGSFVWTQVICLRFIFGLFLMSLYTQQCNHKGVFLRCEKYTKAHVGQETIRKQKLNSPSEAMV